MKCEWLYRRVGVLAEGWADFRSRTWLWAVTVQFAFFNLITWAPWMVLGPVLSRAYLGGAAVWGVIMAVQGLGGTAAGPLPPGPRPPRPVGASPPRSFCSPLPHSPTPFHPPPPP